MPKPKKYRVNKDRSKATKIDPKTRNSVECKCLLYCRGGKLVDPRTFKKHQKKLKQHQAIVTGKSKKRKIRTGAIENISDYEEMVQTDDDDESERTNDDESEWTDDDESERTDDDESERTNDDESERTNDDEPDNEPIDVPKR
jgi:hypothetical protein